MKTSYNPKMQDFEISWPGRVSRHDLVYLSPPSDPMQYGIPIGNGELGALIWCDDRRIIIAVNKSDLWMCGNESSNRWLGNFGNDVLRYQTPEFQNQS